MGKFKAGDRVKFTHDFVFHKDGMLNTITKGATGKVVEEYTAFYGDKYYSIKLDGNKDCYAGRVPVSIIKLISRNIAIKHIINDRATIVILPDGRKGVAKCHPDDKFDEYEGLRIATARAYGKEPFPKEERKDEKKEPKYKFNVGDVVVVLDYGEGYADYESKFQEITSQENCKSVSWKGGYVLEEGTFVKIIGRGQNDNSYYGNVYAIQDFDGNGYLIGEKGIAKVEVNI